MTKETVRDVLRDKLPALVVSALLLLCVLLISHFTYSKNLNKEYFNTAPLAAPDTTSIESFEENDDEGTEQVLGEVLEETPQVTDDYFADAVLVGDSLTEGFSLYNINENLQVIYCRGINPTSAQTHQFYELPDGTLLTMAEAINYVGARKIYLMLGTNGLNWSSPETLIQGYSDLYDIIARCNPDSYIIIESLFYTTAAAAQERTCYSTENIDLYNSLLKQLAMEKGAYYLDTNSIFNDGTGHMPTSISAPDGIHLVPSSYQKWYEYIATHTIKGKSAFGLGADGLIEPVSIRAQTEDAQQSEEEQG